MITVYLTDIHEMPDPLDAPALIRPLTEERRDRILRCRRAETRRLGCAAGLLLAAVLPAYGLNPASLLKGPQGRPLSPGTTDFNLSHSGEGAILAVSDHPVGCDLERLRIPPASFARRFFSDEEQRWICGQSGMRQAEAFFRIWTARESYLKLTGEGLTVPLHAFSAVPGEAGCRIVRENKTEDCRIWQSSVLILDSGPPSSDGPASASSIRPGAEASSSRYILSVAGPAASAAPRIRRIGFRNLLELIRKPEIQESVLTRDESTVWL